MIRRLFFLLVVTIIVTGGNSAVEAQGNATLILRRNIVDEPLSIVNLLYSQYLKDSLLNIEEESNPISDKIDMPIEHQLYLLEMCKERGLDYVKTLALIGHESQFREDAISNTKDYGYMQINKINHEHLSSLLKTSNNPLDPYTNINWGTYILSDLYDYWSNNGIYGESLDIYVWSSYNKGINGFKKSGEASNYIRKIREQIEIIEGMLETEKKG